MRQDPANTGASVCSAPTRPSMGTSRPPSPAPSASAMLRASCAAARWALRVSSLPASRTAGPPVSKCSGRDAGPGSSSSHWASASLAIKWALLGSEGTDGNHSRASCRGRLQRGRGRVCLSAMPQWRPLPGPAQWLSVSLSKWLHRCLGMGWAPGQDKVRVGGIGLRRFLWLMCGGRISGETRKLRRKWVQWPRG